MRDAEDHPAVATRSWLARRPWEGVTLPDVVLDIPTMISVEERAFLYSLARDYYSRSGKIIDAGCFVGGSTLALARGVLDRDEAAVDARVIETFDLFRLEEYSYANYAFELDGVLPGDWLRPTFERLLGESKAVVNVHEGDIRRARWDEDPVEILFIDIAKHWSINDHVTRMFFPALLPEQSVVIQQDYVHEWTPWLHITMELLDDAFDYVDTVPYSAAVFVPRRKITLDELPNDLFDEVPHAEKLALYDRATRRYNGEDQGVLECGRAYLLHLLGDTQAAREHLDHVERQYEGPRIDGILPDMRGTFAEHGSS